MSTAVRTTAAAPAAGSGTAGAPAGYPPLRTAAITLGLLILTMTLGYIDKQVIVFVVDPMRASFGLTDAQMGLLQGFSATLFVALMSMPFGWAVDRWNRRNILVACMLAWSAMTVATGLARSYEAVFLTRVGLGIAEACLYPAAVSMLADLFDPERRPTANLFLIGGANVSIMVAYTLCGTLVEYTPALVERMDFLPADFEPWRMAFVLVALPVPLVAGLLMLVPEPARQSPARAGADAGPAGQANFVRYAAVNWRVVATYPVAIALCVVALDATLQWLPTALSRGFSMHAGGIGVQIGVAAAAGALLAPFAANFLYRRFKRRDPRMPELSIMVLACALSLVPAAAFAAAVSAPQVVAAFALLGLLVCVVTSYNYYVLQRIAPGRLRGQMTAFSLVVRALVAGGGIWMIGALSDHGFGGGLLSSMTAVGVGSLAAAILLLVLVRRRYVPLVEAIERDEAAAAAGPGAHRVAGGAAGPAADPAPGPVSPGESRP